MSPLKTILACNNNCNEISTTFPTYFKIQTAYSCAAAIVQPASHLCLQLCLPSYIPSILMKGSLIVIRTGTTSSKFSKSIVSLLWNQSYFSPLSSVQWILQQPVATFGAVHMAMLHSHVAAVVHSCGIWHTAADGANGVGPEVHLPPIVNPHLILLSRGSHFLVILYECER